LGVDDRHLGQVQLDDGTANNRFSFWTQPAGAATYAANYY
jgi:hypothetical protein